MSFSDLFDLGSCSDMSFGTGAPMPADADAAAGGGGSLGSQQADVEGGQGSMDQMGTTGGGGVVIRDAADSGARNSREDDDGSESESVNVDGGGSGEDVEQANSRKRKKKYIRHTPQQIQELENLFKESPHPDENQRMELGKRLNLESRQVKFWFQNRRTQMKTQIERHENSLLKQENDKLRAENISIREAIKNPICSNCGSPSVLGEVQAEEQQLGIENARLKDEFERVCALATKFLGKQVAPLTSCYPFSSLELTVGTGPYAPGPSMPKVPPPRPAMPAVTQTPTMPAVVPPPPTMPAVVPLPPTMPVMAPMLTMPTVVPPPLTIPAVVPPPPAMPAVPPSLTMPVVAPPTMPAVPLDIISSPPMGSVVTPPLRMMDRSVERSMFLELAVVAMNELVKMAQLGEPLWVAGVEIGKVMLNYNEYLRMFPRCINTKPLEFVSECTRESGMVIGNSMVLVDTLMDGSRWMDMFPSMVGGTATTEIISNGVGGTRNGALQLMHAELQVLSPLVPNREVNFLRFCKQHAEGVWAVVDVSVDGICDFPLSGVSNMSCRRLPSGCLVQDMPNGYSKVTWVEHAEYDEMAVHQIYRPLVRSGMGLGAQRWIATLQRHCECLAFLMSPSMSIRDTPGITASARRSIVKLAQRMTNNFCIGACASSSLEWNVLNSPGEIWENTRVMTRNNIEGEPPGIVLCASMSMWMPISPRRVFDFLCNDQLRCHWDVLSITGPLQEIVHVAKGQDRGNAVSLFRVGDLNDDQYAMLMLQDTCTDASGSTFVYAPVDIPSMHLMMNGGEPTCVAILPSGFAIVPDGPNFDGLGPLDGTGDPNGGSLVSVVFQILVESLPGSELSPESVGMVNNLITCSLQKIKVALNPEN